MRVRLSQGRIARARKAQADDPTAGSVAESDPESWPQYVLDWDEEGVPHVVDVDASIEWDGWRVAELDQVEGGDL